MRNDKGVSRWALVTMMILLLAAISWVSSATPVAAATRLVTDCGDSGPNTLRGQIATAGVGDTILFNFDCTITLTSGTLKLAQDVTIDGTGHTVTVDGNNAVNVFTVNPGVTAQLGHLTIQHGNGQSGTGSGLGGIVNRGTLTIATSTISGNAAGCFGGGIFNAGTLTVVTSTIASNFAGCEGGGIYNNFPDGRLTLANSTLVGNVSDHQGGGISNRSTMTPMTVVNSTLFGNRAESGGGIATFNNGTMTLTNTIVATSTGGDLVTSTGAVFTGTNNLIDDAATAGGFTDGVSGNIVGHPAMLGTLGNYGGPTQTIPPLTGSPAIDAANPAVCAAPPISGTDQRGYLRKADRCSIGAYEADPSVPGTLPGTRPTEAPGGAPNPLPSPRTGGSSQGAGAVQPTPLPMPAPRP
jgi:hypothetical protein